MNLIIISYVVYDKNMRYENTTIYMHNKRMTFESTRY